MRRLRSTLSSPRTGVLLGGATLLGAGAAVLWREHRTLRARTRLGGAALEALLNAIDANDPVTGAHVRRVARYALVLADAVGLDAHQLHSVERVALFHDIGKIHEALFDVIHDRTALTPAERRAVMTHPERGAEVLAPLAAFYPDLPKGVIAHHERWDGSGYPRGIKGGRIPLVARIVAIADTFDAITHQRRYSKARGVVAARAAIAAGRGTQFDPILVDLFLAPPVVEQVDALLRGEARGDGGEHPITRRGERNRRSRHGEPLHAPDVSFRWRSPFGARHARGRAPRR